MKTQQTNQLIFEVLKEYDLFDNLLCWLYWLEEDKHGTKQLEVMGVFYIFQYVYHLDLTIKINTKFEIMNMD